MFKKILLLSAIALALSGCGINSDNPKDVKNKGIGVDSIPLAVDDEAADGYSFIRLTSPQTEQVLKSPFLVGGEAFVPDDAVYIRVTKPNGDILISEQTKVKTNDAKKGPFGVLLHFQFQSTDTGHVEVYGIDPQTGEEVALQSVEVSFDLDL